MTARNSIALIKNAIKVMENQQIFQWDSLYPTKADFLGDIQKQQLFVGLNNNDIAVIYALNKDSDTQYEKGNWKYPDSKYRVIHRLCVNPEYQNRGIGKILFNGKTYIIHINTLQLLPDVNFHCRFARETKAAFL